MYNGIGLTTPRGSGTNGHIQSNKFFVRPKSTTAKDAGGHGPGAGLARKPNRDILEHDRKRQMELKLVVLEDKLADQGYTDSEIAEKISEARKNLEAAAALEAAREDGEVAPLSVSDIKVSDTQTHQVAARKEKQMETLRAALGIVPDAPLEKNELKSIPEDGSDNEISDGSDKDLNDDVKLLKKDHKSKNGDIIKAVKVKKNESCRDGDELKSHKNQGNKELGELTDSSDTETDEKHLRSIPKQLQTYRRGSASESDSNIKSKNLLRGDRKVRKHDNDYSDSDDEKYVKEIRKAHDKRSRRHDIDQVDSDDENYESKERRGERSRKRDSVKSENEKYGQRQDKKSRWHRRDDSLSDHEHYERTSERDDKKSRTRDQLSDNQQKGFEENRRSFRNKDATDQLWEKKSGDGHVDKLLHKTYGDEEPQMEISRKNNLDRKKEERDHRETRRSDYDRTEERDHRERRSDLDRKEERESKRYGRNEDEDNGLIRHRKDDEDSFRKNRRDNLEAEHGRSRRRGREEGEEHTNGREEKNRHADSSKRAKYDDYRSEEKRKYDDDKRDNRDDVRARRRD